MGRLELYHLHVIPATFVFALVHAAVAAFIRSICTHANGIKAIHAIMQAHHYTGSNREINKQQYGGEHSFHEPHKDKPIF